MNRTEFATTAFLRVQSPKRGRTLAWMLTLGFLGIVASLVITPWQQNIVGSGRVVSFDPTERRQDIEATVSGRITSWNVVEGSIVRRGERIAEITDNDPSLVARIGEQREAAATSLEASQNKAGSTEQMIMRLETARLSAISAAIARVAMSNQKIRAAEQSLVATEAALTTSQLNYQRLEGLASKGLASRRNMELATLSLNKATADLDRAKASLSAERSALQAAEADRARIEADANAKIEETRAKLSAGLSDAAKARGELVKMDVQLARQKSQSVTAPINGTVIRVVGRQGGDMVKQGDVLAEIIPDSTRLVVELYVDGNDVPLISAGRSVRLQFEGWPALQFSGWPSVAVGTFGGRILLVDAADNGRGQFRVLVGPDPEDQPWPEARYLRQGVQVNGWVLLNQVSLGYELWRQFNGFPPTVADPRTQPSDGGGK